MKNPFVSLSLAASILVMSFSSAASAGNPSFECTVVRVGSKISVLGNMVIEPFRQDKKSVILNDEKDTVTCGGLRNDRTSVNSLYCLYGSSDSTVKLYRSPIGNRVMAVQSHKVTGQSVGVVISSTEETANDLVLMVPTQDGEVAVFATVCERTGQKR